MLASLVLSAMLRSQTAAAASQPDPGDPEIPGVDEQLSIADTTLAKLERSMAGAIPEERRTAAAVVNECRASFSIDKTLKDLSSGAYSLEDQKTIKEGILLPAGWYFVYKAFAARSPELCSALSPFQYNVSALARLPGEEWCRHEYKQMVFARELNSPSPRFAEACSSLIDDGYSGLLKDSPDAVAEECRIIERNRRDAGAACAALAPRFEKPEYIEDCRCGLGEMTGRPDLCTTPRGDPSGGHAEHHAGFAAFSRAYRAKNPGICGKSLMCRRIMGVDVSGQLAAQARDVVCKDQRRIVSAKLKDAAAELSKLAARGDASGAPLSLEMRKRMERLAILRYRLSQDEKVH